MRMTFQHFNSADLLKDDVDKDKKRAATQAAFKRKFKKNSDFWVYEKKIRLVIRKAIKQQWFYWTVIVLVFFNTFCVAIEHYGQPLWLSDFLRKIRLYFLFIIFQMTISRHGRIHFPDFLYFRDVGEDVGSGTSHLL